MSEQVKGLTVAFAGDVSEEYAEQIATAISHFHNVAQVDFVKHDSINDWINRSQISRKYEQAIFDTMEKLRAK